MQNDAKCRGNRPENMRRNPRSCGENTHGSQVRQPGSRVPLPSAWIKQKQFIAFLLLYCSKSLVAPP